MKQFTDRVFDVVRRISDGKTMTYLEVAKAAGSPHAYRAVGNILGKNCDPKIPCHRVIRGDGKPGGYAFGTNQKKHLLNKEKLGHVTFKERVQLFQKRMK